MEPPLLLLLLLLLEEEEEEDGPDEGEPPPNWKLIPVGSVPVSPLAVTTPNAVT